MATPATGSTPAITTPKVVVVPRTGLPTWEERQDSATKLCNCMYPDSAKYTAINPEPIKPPGGEIFQFEEAHGADVWECQKK